MTSAALILLQFMTGVFFAVTGYRKLFHIEVATQIQKVFDSHGVPYWLGLLVVSGEFAGGLGLLLGVLPRFAALGLIPIMLGAYVMDTWPAVWAKQSKPLDYTKLVSNTLCTPEAQLLLIVIALALAGGGYVL